MANAFYRLFAVRRFFVVSPLFRYCSRIVYSGLFTLSTSLLLSSPQFACRAKELPWAKRSTLSQIFTGDFLLPKWSVLGALVSAYYLSCNFIFENSFAPFGWVFSEYLYIRYLYFYSIAAVIFSHWRVSSWDTRLSTMQGRCYPTQAIMWTTNTSLLSCFCCWWHDCLLSIVVYFPLSFFASVLSFFYLLYLLLTLYIPEVR